MNRRPANNDKRQHRRRPWLRTALPLTVAAALIASALIALAPGAQAAVTFPVESLDGTGNNVANPNWGKAGQAYSRVGPAKYTDGISVPFGGPNARQISNRIISDINQNIFSERRVTQWGWTWGQFLDHTFGLRDAAGPTATTQNIAFQPGDELEDFTDNLGIIPFNRSAATAGTGTSTSNPRQQTNTLPSYVGANTVYGASNARLDWLRAGSLDGNPTNNSAMLLLGADNYLPRRTARGNAANAPAMDVDGRLLANPGNATVAGDARANENVALTATQTLFAREHNRIVSLLPSTLSEEDKFQIARRVVIAEEQYITYQEFLPAMGVALPRYSGYKSNINTTLSNEFATVGYRAHSQIHGEFEIEGDADRYSASTLDALEDAGAEVAVDGDEIEIDVPLGLAFFNPDLLQQLQLGPMLQALGAESEYNNDEQIDNQLRSTLFQVPVPGNNATSSDVAGLQTSCLDGPTMPQCFNGVVDLGAVDIQRGRDHGIGTYNQLRAAYGLSAKTSFTAITGENTESFPSDSTLTPGNEINDPNILDVRQLFDIDGKAIDLANADAVANTATRAVRRTTVAARLKAVYTTPDKVDAFVGITAEPHVAGTEFGETQLAIWTREFQRLRDGDRFFFGNDQGLSTIKSTYGIDYRRTLSQIIASNTDIPAAELNPDVFLVADANLPATTCKVTYNINATTNGAFQTILTIANTSSSPIVGWTMRFQFANGQNIFQTSNGVFNQSGPNGRNVSVSNLGLVNATIPAGRSITNVAFNASFDNFTNAKPPNISLNNRRCAVA